MEQAQQNDVEQKKHGNGGHPQLRFLCRSHETRPMSTQVLRYQYINLWAIKAVTGAPLFHWSNSKNCFAQSNNDGWLSDPDIGVFSCWETTKRWPNGILLLFRQTRPRTMPLQKIFSVAIKRMRLREWASSSHPKWDVPVAHLAFLLSPGIDRKSVV